MIKNSTQNAIGDPGSIEVVVVQEVVGFEVENRVALVLQAEDLPTFRELAEGAGHHPVEAVGRAKGLGARVEVETVLRLLTRSHCFSVKRPG